MPGNTYAPMAKDVHIITGMDAIINKENTRPGIDFKELERDLINGGIITKKSRDPQDRFNEELKEFAKKLGINFGDTDASTSSGATGSSHTGTTAIRPPSPPRRTSTTPQETTRPPEQTRQEDDDSDDYEAPTGGYSTSGPQSALQAPIAAGFSTNPFTDTGRPRFGADLTTRTQEQERQSHIDSVVGGSASSFSLENEKREDNKCAMLADIDSLTSSLSDENVDLSRVPRVDRNSSYDEVESVLKMLRHKNDHARYCSFAEEFLIFGAYALEELFDGKRKWFGHYQPDLTGWHNHVNIKIKRMQHDTSKIVSEVMQDYNIVSGARLLLELIPSMVLYSKMRKQQHGEPGLFSDISMADATRNVRTL